MRDKFYPGGVLEGESGGTAANPAFFNWLQDQLALTRDRVIDPRMPPYNVSEYGGSTDIYGGLQQAIYDAAAYRRYLYLPAAVINGGLGTYYTCSQALLIPPNLEFGGGGRLNTEIRFPNNTDGIVPANALGTGTPNVLIENIYLKGVAPTSVSSTITRGMWVRDINHWRLNNMYVEDFVDQYSFDAGSWGFATLTARNCYGICVKYPNQTNGYPRYLVDVTSYSGLRRAQGLWFEGLLYSNLSARGLSPRPVGDGSTTTFDFDIGQNLYKATGLKVTLWNDARAALVRQVQGTDYDLYYTDDGAPVLISPSAVYVGKRHMRVIFRTPPPAPAVPGYGNIRIDWIDPYAKAGLHLQYSNGNTFKSSISGCEVASDEIDSPNDVFLPAIQICDIGRRIGPRTVGATGRVGNATGSNVGTKTQYDPAASWPTIVDGAGREWTSLKRTTDRTLSSAQVLAWDSPGGSGIMAFKVWNTTPREVEVDLQLELTNASAGDARATVTLQTSIDNAITWTDLTSETVGDTLTGVTALTLKRRSRLFYEDDRSTGLDNDQSSLSIDTDAADGSIIFKVLYRVMITPLAGTVTVKGSPSNGLRVREVNPRNQL